MKRALLYALAVLWILAFVWQSIAHAAPRRMLCRVPEMYSCNVQFLHHRELIPERITGV